MFFQQFMGCNGITSKLDIQKSLFVILTVYSYDLLCPYDFWAAWTEWKYCKE
jgi:hypothetical protein